MRIGFCIASLFLFIGAAFAQLPQCGAVAGWTQQGRPRAYTADDLFEYMNGNSEGYFVYKFVAMKGITCQSGEDTIVIDISEFADPEYAYGMFTSTRDRLPTEKIGTAGQVTSRRIFFVKDKYYVELGANPDKDFTSQLRRYASAIEKSISGTTTLPAILDWFPKEHLANDYAVRLVPDSVLGMRLLKSGYVGQYDFGKAFIVKEASPDAASQLMKKLKERFGQTTPAHMTLGPNDEFRWDLWDEAFTATDKYLDGMCVFRKGNYIGGFANLKSGRDGVVESTRLALGIK
jgi:hypothetical protein